MQEISKDKKKERRQEPEKPKLSKDDFLEQDIATLKIRIQKEEEAKKEHQQRLKDTLEK